MRLRRLHGHTGLTEDGGIVCSVAAMSIGLSHNTAMYPFVKLQTITILLFCHQRIVASPDPYRGLQLNARQARSGLCDEHLTYDPERIRWRKLRAEIGQLANIIKELSLLDGLSGRHGKSLEVAHGLRKISFGKHWTSCSVRRRVCGRRG